jgi:soluble lytic murein transglycosylase-like protein
MRSSCLVLLSCLLLPATGKAACFDEAAARYRLPVSLLQAISRVESAGRPDAINRNKNGSYDIGHMQINSGWLPLLKRYGIEERMLFDACTNTHVGAWILAQSVAKLGYNWDAIGAYNAASPQKRLRYAWKVAAVLQRKETRSSGG